MYLVLRHAYLSPDNLLHVSLSLCFIRLRITCRSHQKAKYRCVLHVAALQTFRRLEP